MRADESVQKVRSGKVDNREQWVTAPIAASQAVDRTPTPVLHSS